MRHLRTTKIEIRSKEDFVSVCEMLEQDYDFSKIEEITESLPYPYNAIHYRIKFTENFSKEDIIKFFHLPQNANKDIRNFEQLEDNTVSFRLAL